MYKKIATVCLATATILGIGQVMASNVKEQMIEDLQFIGNRFKTTYAPIDWKREYASWDVDQRLEDSKLKIMAADTITVDDYQLILKDFLDSSKDYHVGYSFHHTKNARLHFTVKGAAGKYFISYVNRDKLSKTEFPFEVGDELVEFDGKPTSEAVKELYNSESPNVVETDSAIAELMLTSRRAARLMDVPSGPITIKVKPQRTDNLVKRQLIWEFQKERVQNHLTDNNNRLDKYQQNLVKFLDFQMVANKELIAAQENPHGLGNRDSFLPQLGVKTWESESNSLFQAYIYTHESGKRVGYVRIPSYSRDMWDAMDGLDIKEFAGLMKKFEDSTDALVVDQLNNPGGSVFYLYGLASMLTTQPLVTPRHEMAISQEDVVGALEVLDAGESSIPEYMQEMLTNMIGYPFTNQFMQFYRNYAQFIVDEWNAGKTRTSPYHIGGVDHINPNSDANYSKQIMILVNSLDFSGGDFFPAIMQDNKRATIVGTRTAGAGGYITMVQYPNIFGLEYLVYTASIAERVNKQPIENLGVTPDVQLDLTENDLQNNYVDYIKGVNTQLNNLFK